MIKYIWSLYIFLEFLIQFWITCQQINENMFSVSNCFTLFFFFFRFICICRLGFFHSIWTYFFFICECMVFICLINLFINSLCFCFQFSLCLFQIYELFLLDSFLFYYICIKLTLFFHFIFKFILSFQFFF